MPLPGFITSNPALTGALLMTGSAACFAVMSILVRIATQDLHVMEVTFWRNALAVVVVLPWFLQQGRRAFRITRPGLLLIRAIVGLAAMFTIFTAISLAPVAEVAALNFTVPIFATALAPFLIAEKVGVRRWSATLVGFLGAMVVLRPGIAEVSTGGMLALGAAVLMALALSMVKILTRTDRPQQIVALTALIWTPLSAIPASFYWTGPQDLTMMGILFAIAALGTLAQNLLTQAFQRADQSYVIAFDFLRLPFIAGLAYLAFDETVEIWTWIGAAIIFSSVIYIARRESRLKKDVTATDDRRVKQEGLN